MSVGFTHGVLNTDNMSLASITIDYGPFGILEAYQPDFIPNHSDDSGRYDYESQPDICYWNLGKLATALTPVLHNTKHKQLQYAIIVLVISLVSRNFFAKFITGTFWVVITKPTQKSTRDYFVKNWD